MRKESNVAMFCPLQGVIDIVSKKWALLVVNEVGNHKRIRFNELRSELRDITAKTLTSTLNDLEASGLVTRESFNEMPPRVEYTLTEEGKGLHQIIIPLIKWACSRKDAVVKKCSCKAFL